MCPAQGDADSLTGYIYQVGSSGTAGKVSPWTLHLQVNGLASEWEIDSGAVEAICGDDLYRRLLDRPPLRPEIPKDYSPGVGARLKF